MRMHQYVLATVHRKYASPGSDLKLLSRGFIRAFGSIGDSKYWGPFNYALYHDVGLSAEGLLSICCGWFDTICNLRCLCSIDKTV